MKGCEAHKIIEFNCLAELLKKIKYAHVDDDPVLYFHQLIIYYKH